MPRTIEDLMANHSVANERRRAGRSVWDYAVKIKAILRCFGDRPTDEESITAGGKIATALRAVLPPEWVDRSHDDLDEDLALIIEDLESPPPRDALNETLDQLYDWADRKRVWLG